MNSTPPHTGQQVAAPGNPQAPAAWQLLHGVTLRPPLMRWNGQAYTGARLASLNDTEAAHLTGVVKVVRHHNFVGVVASQPQQARRACSLLDAQWMMPVDGPANAAALEAPQHATASRQPDTFQRQYSWQTSPPEQAAYAIASYDGQQLSVWANVSHAKQLREELALLCSVPADAVQVYTLNAAPAYDAAVDAALLSLHVGRPVRVESQAEAYPQDIHIAWQAHQSAETACYQATDASAQARPSVAALLCGLHYPAQTKMVLQADTQQEQAEPGLFLLGVGLQHHFGLGGVVQPA